MKQKIFDKMIEYGWNLGDNTYKDFDNVFESHKRFIDSIYDYFVECDNYGESVDLSAINEERMYEMLCFITDFLRAINDCSVVRCHNEE